MQSHLSFDETAESRLILSQSRFRLESYGCYKTLHLWNKNKALIVIKVCVG